jgi:hypothetical protein
MEGASHNRSSRSDPIGRNAAADIVSRLWLVTPTVKLYRVEMSDTSTLNYTAKNWRMGVFIVLV